MRKILEKMKAKPDHIKDRIAVGSSLAITAVIFVFWLATFDTTNNLAKDDANRSIVAPSPAETLSASVLGAFSSIKEIFSGETKMDLNSDVIELVPVDKSNR